METGREVLAILVAEIQDRRVQARIRNRYGAMLRELSYLSDSTSTHSAKDIQLLLRRHWTLDRLSVLCALNSFYQEVLGPLYSASRKQAARSAFAKVPIRHGAVLFDDGQAKRVRSMEYDFFRKFSDFGADRAVMNAPTAGSVIFLLAQRERERHE
jgi:hypothetical protein